MRFAISILFSLSFCDAQIGSISSPRYYATPPFPPFPGERLNDASSCGKADGNQNATYIADITSRGTPDTFSWRIDGGPSSASTGITGGCQMLSDGVGIRFGHTTGHTPTDQWVIGVSAVGPDNTRGNLKLNDLLFAAEFQVDPSGQADSTAGLQAGIDASRLKGRCLTLAGGWYKIGGSGLRMNGGECLWANGQNQVTLEMSRDNMTAITVQGMSNKVAGLRITKGRGVAGGIGILVNGTSPATGTAFTEDTHVEDIYIVADDPARNLLTAGVKILSGPGYETKWTHLRAVHVQGAEDGLVIQSLDRGTASNGNWGTDLWLENSTRCLHIISAGENAFNGLALNGCASDGTVRSAPIVIESNGIGPDSTGNLISESIGESNNPVAVIDSASRNNTLILPTVVYLGQTVVDNSNGRNTILSNGNFVPGYDAHGSPTLWIGAAIAHLNTVYSTFQISEAGNRDIMRIQRATLPNHSELAASWLDFNPYQNGLYINGAPDYQGSMLKLDTNRTEGYVSGNIDFMRHGSLYANLQAVTVDPRVSQETEMHLSTAPAQGGALTDRGAIATRIRSRQPVSLGEIANGACVSGTMSLPGAQPGDSLAPGWPAGVLAAKVVGSMTVDKPNTVLITVCNFSGTAISGNDSYGASVVR